MSSAPDKIVYIIAGPTAVGKTSLSIQLAQKLNAEIISADSRQFYRYMDIGTAKVDKQSRRLVPHHFIDILDPDQTYSAGQFSEQARAKIGTILGRGRNVFVVGGSGLYIRALVDGIVELPKRDMQIRKAVEQELLLRGYQDLLSELEKIDHQYAAKLNKNDTQRLVRALEVYRQTGKTFSWWHAQETVHADFKTVFIGLQAPRDLLYERINQRTSAMLEAGLIDEVKHLAALGYGPRLNALQTVGYQEVFQYLDGKLNLSEMESLISRNTRRYAKRQMTWFRAEERMHWFELKHIHQLDALCMDVFEFIRANE